MLCARVNNTQKHTHNIRDSRRRFLALTNKKAPESKSTYIKKQAPPTTNTHQMIHTQWETTKLPQFGSWRETSALSLPGTTFNIAHAAWSKHQQSEMIKWWRVPFYVSHHRCITKLYSARSCRGHLCWAVSFQQDAHFIASSSSSTFIVCIFAFCAAQWPVALLLIARRNAERYVTDAGRIHK